MKVKFENIIYTSFTVDLKKEKKKMNENHKKQHNLTFLGSLVLFIGIIIIGFNYWHAMSCVQVINSYDIKEVTNKLEQRVLEAESKVYKYKKERINLLFILFIYFIYLIVIIII